jgi:hypothetical protein
VGVASSRASAREVNFAVAFFEDALCFFTLQHAGSVFVSDPSGLEKYSRKATLSVLGASQLREQTLLHAH